MQSFALFRFKSLGTSLALAMTLVAFLACAGFAAVLLVNQRNSLDEDTERRLASARTGFETALAAESREVLTASEILAALPAVTQAVVARDRDALLALLRDGQVAAQARGQRLNVHLPPAVNLLRVWRPEQHGDDIASRRGTVVQAATTGRSVAGLEVGAAEVSLFGVAPIRSGGQVVGTMDVALGLTPEVLGRLRDAAGLDFTLYRRTAEGTARIGGGLPGAPDGTLDAAARQSILGGAELRREAQAGGRDFAILAVPLRDFAGQPIGTVEFAYDLSAKAAAFQTALRSVGLTALVMLLLAATAGLLFARGLSRPLKGMTVALEGLAAGRLDASAAGADRRDEIGGMARAFATLRAALVEAERLKAAQAEAEARLAASRAEATAATAAEVEGSLSGVTGALTEAGARLAEAKSRLEETSLRSGAASQDAAQGAGMAAENVRAVAAAAEELAASTSEIGRQVSEAARVASEASQQSRETDAKVQTLTEAASRIGDVVRLINGIAGQTNLLALNATIEAARAGDAGKGFAVVASEVKNLAGQTARATEEIGGQITAMQAAMEAAVSAVADIAATIQRLDGITTAIAGAVEEQGSATREIARSVQEAAVGTSLASTAAERVAGEVDAARGAVQGVGEAIGVIGEQSGRLDAEVGALVRRLRAA
ncbi:methyl-accepting chemotaxis protein [Roseococcus microcysteis]|uniref:methyl-accepting chemotaxis protein n=1 Tax=Roseococcus microcysteis TaxID=2771361 RepID=UPI00168BBDAB|nr:methyl-accepting chemotaxis protein [Roseococcus microcysteis]